MKSKNVNIDVSESGNFFKPRRNNNKKILNLMIASICKLKLKRRMLFYSIEGMKPDLI